MNATQRTRFIAPLLLTAVLLASCGHSSSSTKPQADPLAGAPAPSSPANSVLRYVWAYDHEKLTALNGLLTSDFRFAFAAADSSISPYPGHAWPLTQELLSATHMFSGVDSFPAAQSIALTLDPVLTPLPDARPGKNPRWHQQIRSAALFDIVEALPEGSFEQHGPSGYILFHVVRGDSAVIDSGATAAGFHPDSTRWWIDRIEDQTAGVVPAFRALPTRNETLGMVKVWYLSPTVTVPRP